MAGPAQFLHVDMVLAALIASAGDSIEELIALVESQGGRFAILELALYYAVCCVEANDRVDMARFARLLQVSDIVPSPKPFDRPSVEEIANWRAAALGTQED